MRFHSGFMTFFLALAQARSKDCAVSWPTIKPGKAGTVAGKCDSFPKYPQTFDGTKVTVIYTPGWRQLAVTTDRAAAVLQEGLSKSIGLYSAFASVPPHIVVVLTVGKDPYTVDAGYPIDRKPPCEIITYPKWNAWTSSNMPGAMQWLAHGVYRCVQGYAKVGQVADASQWVLDGSAGYFSNLVFPDANIEWPGKESGYQYHPSRPIYAQKGRDSSATVLFFQVLGQKMGPSEIHRWVVSTIPAHSTLKERSRLSKLTGFTDNFFFFAQQFSLQDILDTSKAPIPNLLPTNPTHAKLTLQASGKVGTASLRTVPFTMTVFEITIDHGQTVTIAASLKSSQRLAYRRPSDKTWTEVPNGPSKGPETIPALDCNDEDDAESILILFVSTADTASDTVKITITQKDADPNCPCRSSTKPHRRGLQSCQVAPSGGFSHWPLFNPSTSGGYCPTATHIGSIAIWCCPTGTELDKTVASELSICCPTSVDCSKKIVPNNLRCADPSWVLWSKEFRQIGCCMKGYAPNSLRYCIKNGSPGPGYSTVAQVSAPTGVVA